MKTDIKKQQLTKKLLSNWKLRFFLWNKLPSLFFWKLKIRNLDSQSCSVSIPFNRNTQNPFNSVYFAAQAGAAEFSTGVLVLVAIESFGKTSMLVTSVNGEFYKKACSDLIFVCKDGLKAEEAAKETHKTGQGVSFQMVSEGIDAAGDIVSRFTLEWSIKKKH